MADLVTPSRRASSSMLVASKPRSLNTATATSSSESSECPGLPRRAGAAVTDGPGGQEWPLLPRSRAVPVVGEPLQLAHRAGQRLGIDDADLDAGAHGVLHRLLDL